MMKAKDIRDKKARRLREKQKRMEKFNQGMVGSKSEAQLPMSNKNGNYAGVDPKYAPHPHYYPPRPLPDEGAQYFFPPLN